MQSLFFFYALAQSKLVANVSIAFTYTLFQYSCNWQNTFSLLCLCPFPHTKDYSKKYIERVVESLDSYFSMHTRKTPDVHTKCIFRIHSQTEAKRLYFWPEYISILQKSEVWNSTADYAIPANSIWLKNIFITQIPY